MAFLDKTGLQTLTNKLVQGDAIKVASPRGYTVKNVIDNITRECDDVANPQTMFLEDKTGHFMIGKGKDVDVSGDVESGKMAFGFKGRTLENIIYPNTEFRKQANGFAKVDDSLIMDGREALVNGGMIFSGKNPLKPNMYYTIFYEVLRNDNFSSYIFMDSHVNYAFNNTVLDMTPGKHKKLIKTKTTANWINAPQTHFKIGVNGTQGPAGYLELSANIMILEGNWMEKEMPSYFTGIKSSFETEEDRKIIHTGKNLWKKGDAVLNRFDIYSLSDTSPILKANTDYTISVGNIKKAIDNGEYPHLRLSAAGEKDEQLANYSIRPNSTFVVRTKKDVRMLIFYSNGFNWNGSKNHFATIENFQIEEGKGATEYAPYIKEEKVIELDEPLRGLPDGTCDEITEDGTLIRRIKKISINQLQVLAADNNLTKTVRGAIDTPDIKDGCHLISSGVFTPITSGTSSEDYENVQATGGRIYIRVLKTRLTQINNAGISDWLKKQPDIFIYYELKEPQISNTSRIALDTSQHNRIDVSSAIAPITTYKVPLNRAAQIDNSIKTIQDLKQRIELLEQAYDNHFLESQYKLSLLKLDYQNESEEI